VWAVKACLYLFDPFLAYCARKVATEYKNSKRSVCNAAAERVHYRVQNRQNSNVQCTNIQQYADGDFLNMILSVAAALVEA